MNVAQMLVELRRQRDAVDLAIAAIAPLADGGLRVIAREPPNKTRVKRQLTVESRKKMAEGQRRRWAKERTADG